MKATSFLPLALVSVVAMQPFGAPADVHAQAPTVKIPQAGVPQVMTMEGTLRPRRVQQRRLRHPRLPARQPVGRRGVDAPRVRHDAARRRAGLQAEARRTLARDARRQDAFRWRRMQEYRGANLRPVCRCGRRCSATRSTTFRPARTRPAESGSSAEMDQRAMAWDEVELTNRRACLGRLFFKVPGGIAYGQHWLNVKFQNSLIRVPFRILTKDEEKLLSQELQEHPEADRRRLQEEELTISTYPSLFQINTRVWLTELSRGLGRPATLDDIPERRAGSPGAAGVRLDLAVERLADGSGRAARIAQQPRVATRIRGNATRPAAKRTSADPGLRSPATPCIRSWAAMPRWPAFASACDKRGLKLMLDFVPNHTGLGHPWVENHPEYFIPGTEFDLAQAPQNYTRVKRAGGDLHTGVRARSVLFWLAGHAATRLQQPGDSGFDDWRTAEDRRAM